MSDETAKTPPGCLKVCAIADLGEGEARRFDLDELRLAIVHGEGEQWFAIDDECTHADYSLAEGEIDVEDCTIECWKHGSLFNLKTGTPETLPATRAVQTYEVVLDESTVFIRLPTPSESA